jgi:hypothetical protein
MWGNINGSDTKIHTFVVDQEVVHTLLVHLRIVRGFDLCARLLKTTASREKPGGEANPGSKRNQSNSSKVEHITQATLAIASSR